MSRLARRVVQSISTAKLLSAADDVDRRTSFNHLLEKKLEQADEGFGPGFAICDVSISENGESGRDQKQDTFSFH